MKRNGKAREATDACGCPAPDGKGNHQKNINLALQGGGSHGAFTWGVMDRFIEDGRLKIDGLCGTSAGAMNAVVYAYGNMVGGAEGARQAMHAFWKDVSDTARMFNPMGSPPWEKMFDQWNIDTSFSFNLFDLMSRTFSPYQFNPMNINPLRDILAKAVDFEVLNRCQETRLFVSTTKIRTGKVRVFTTDEITLDVVMASACLPQLYQAVEIDKEYYWDGGYMGNPAIFPLFYHTETRDVVIIHINPLIREGLPTDASEIMDRLNEIEFNSSLMKELRSIAFVTKLIEEGWLKDEYKDRLKHMFVHSVRADKILCDLKVSSKFNSDWTFLTDLFERGRATADWWLQKNYEAIGNQSTVDLKKEFFDIGTEHAG
ncbi:patatin-like phospholipase family protein [Desulfoluna sp.]|uniref:patatin-like phospholipase family protein n=1 Tax=Desulfoluna sp. TaxID=2045199 RepID=UPI0026308C1C|nr:patatin-like phospholipase family protein [Desulfoluna sp.]